MISVWLVIAAIAVQAFTPVAKLFESSMILHMLVQLPLLFFLGMALAKARFVSSLFRFDLNGFVCAAIVSTAIVYWMLPINLDAAIESNFHRVLKLITVPLSGVAISVAWGRLPWLFRGVLALELWAMFLRTGWLYIVADEQLCSYYLQSEQYLVGWLLCLVGLGVAGGFALWLIFGNPMSQPQAQ